MHVVVGFHSVAFCGSQHPAKKSTGHSKRIPTSNAVAALLHTPNLEKPFLSGNPSSGCVLEFCIIAGRWCALKCPRHGGCFLCSSFQDSNVLFGNVRVQSDPSLLDRSCLHKLYMPRETLATLGRAVSCCKTACGMNSSTRCFRPILSPRVRRSVGVFRFRFLLHSFFTSPGPDLMKWVNHTHGHHGWHHVHGEKKMPGCPDPMWRTRLARLGWKRCG